MAKKIEAAVKAKKDPDFIINARTDAIAVEGLDKAIERARLYIAAGADMVFPDAVASEEQIKRFVDAVDAPVSINIGFGIRSRPTTPLIPIKRLAELGVARVTMARMLPSAALMGMHKALELMRDHVATGTIHDRPDLLYGMEEITELMGYSKIAELEAQFLPDDQLERKAIIRSWTKSITWCENASHNVQGRCSSRIYAHRMARIPAGSCPPDPMAAE